MSRAGRPKQEPDPPKKKRLRPPPSRYAGFMDGTLSVEDLDDEEIMRGQLKARDGTFKGSAPKSIPREFYTAIRIEQQKRFTEKLHPLVLDALTILQHVMKPDYRAQPGDAAKVKSATYIIDRFAGKTPENVQLKAEVFNKFENVAADILVDVDEERSIESSPTKEEDDDLGDI